MQTAGGFLKIDNKKYTVIYADPAWKVGYMQGGKTAGSLGKGKPVPYSVMTDKQIMAMPIKNMAEENAVLFMWVVDCKIPKIEQIMKAWGFNFKGIAFDWNKTTKNPSKTGVRAILSTPTRRSHEICYYGTRGKVGALLKSNTVLQDVQWASEDRRHSAKPPIVAERISEMYGDVSKIELFARDKKEGWDVWGNEVADSIEIEKYLTN